MLQIPLPDENKIILGVCFKLYRPFMELLGLNSNYYSKHCLLYLYPVYTIQQTSSKCIQNTRANCWTFAISCKHPIKLREQGCSADEVFDELQSLYRVQQKKVAP